MGFTVTSLPEPTGRQDTISVIYTWLARHWLLLSTALVTTPACLPTSKPDPEPILRTRPALYAVTPPTSQVIFRDVTQPNNKIDLTAEVVSEDAGQGLAVALLLDYGIAGPGCAPWRDDSPQFLEAGTLADGPRPVPASYYPPPNDEGCHSLTMLATHEPVGVPPYTWCPKDPDDAATLTWFFTLCGAQDAPECYPCPTNLLQPSYCPSDPTAFVPECQ